MNNKEYVASLSQRMGYKNNITQRWLNTILLAMGDSFQEGDSVNIAGFGTFEVKKKMESIMVSPTTGKRMLVPPKLVLGFKPNTSWKDKIKNGDKE